MYKPLALALTPRPRPEQVTREEAERRILEQDEPYKLEILNRIKSDRITIWHTSKKQVHSKCRVSKYRSQHDGGKLLVPLTLTLILTLT